MRTVYTEVPKNWEDIEDYVLCEKDDFVNRIIGSKKVIFYDTCSFRFHSHIKEQERNVLANYYKEEGALLVITRCILMELSSHSGILNSEYIEFFKFLADEKIDVLVLYEESFFDILAECFSTNKSINSFLTWPVRMMNLSVSSIKKAFEENMAIYQTVINGKSCDKGSVYKEFFSLVRSYKESGDNLGEELLAICIHILSHIPMTPDGKYCVITDDKGGAGIIATLIRKTNKQYAGAKIIIYSTPRIVQTLYNLNYRLKKENMVSILNCLGDGRLIIKGATEYDLDVNQNISVSALELAEMIETTNSITILF